ncbi:MAG: radical SAM protein [Methanophagales archaeon ANME-1-THS]|nr:MAG: radical SAM protein [Methanophagales archaeon ANME-1-THS]
MPAPVYLETYERGELEERIEQLMDILNECTLCPRACRVNRTRGETGYCNSGKDLIVSSAQPHYGEEDVLVGTYGSGTIFLTNCNLGCIFCQNYDISHLGYGQRVTGEEFARSMLSLQRRGCHNINLVTPTHFTPQIVKALKIAIEYGLHIPLVYNCGGYESKRTIELLDGIVDIYMPDIKYSDEASARKYSNAPDYFDVCKEAVKEMHRQVGDLTVDAQGVAVRGLLIRHLVLPNHVAGSAEVFKFIATELSKESYVNIMLQYRPMYRAYEYKELNRRITVSEYQEALDSAKDWGLHRGFEY